jgi:hypothetical protein
VGLGHLHADRTAADNDEMPWRPGAFEQGLIGQVLDRIKPGIGGTKADDPVATT